jgi:hypothetical protein
MHKLEFGHAEPDCSDEIPTLPALRRSDVHLSIDAGAIFRRTDWLVRWAWRWRLWERDWPPHEVQVEWDRHAIVVRRVLGTHVRRQPPPPTCHVDIPRLDMAPLTGEQSDSRMSATPSGIRHAPRPLVETAIGQERTPATDRINEVCQTVPHPKSLPGGRARTARGGEGGLCK